MACLLFHLLLGLTILTNTSLQAEKDFGSCSSEIELTVEQREQHDEPTYNLYCKSRKKPFDDSAEFQVDGFSREHILIIKNRCFDRKKQECSLDYCECDPILNGFTVKFKMDYLKVGQTFGCLIRLRNDATGNFLKVFTSNKFNGTDFIPDECNVKVMGTTTDITTTTNNTSRPTGDIGNDTDSNLAIFLLISFVTVEIIIIILFLVKWCQHHRKQQYSRESELPGSETEVRSTTNELETILPTQEHTQTLLEKIMGSETEVRSTTNELETLLPTQEHTQTLLEKIMEKHLDCIEMKFAIKNLHKPNPEEFLEKVKALETEFKILKQESVESTHTAVLSRGINAIQMELTAIEEEYQQKNSKKLNVDDYINIRCESDIIYFGNFYEEQRFKHEQGQELQHEHQFRNERILDMCFVEHMNELYLVYIDADNKNIVRQNIIPGKDRKEGLLKKQPNRLSKINDEAVAVIYKKGLEVLIFNVKEMKEEKTCKMSEQNISESHNGIQGILALSENNFILSDKMHLCVLKLNENEPIVKKLLLENKVEFDTARRLTHAITSDGKKDIIFIADENDKRITSITISPQNEEKESIAGHLIMQQIDHNRGLQNVRAIVATQSRIYAATSAGISVFSHNKGCFKNWESQSSFGQNSEGYKMLVEYKEHVEHTRSLCLHTFHEYIYIGLSCVIKQHDMILVFKLKPNNFFE